MIKDSYYVKFGRYTIITGHCLPFHVFKKNTLDYLNIFEKLDNKMLDTYKQSKNIILCGDMNYEDINKMFPRFLEISKDYIDKPTRHEKIFDHMIATNEVIINEIKVIDSYFDHRLCIIDVKEV